MSIARLDELQDTLATAAAFGAALDLGLFDVLSRGPLSAAELAGRCDVDARVTGLMMEILDGAGAVEAHSDGRFGLAVPLGMVQVAGRLWGGLVQRARHGAPAIAMDGADAEAVYRGIVPHLAEIARDHATWVAERLAAHGLAVLDVGAGAAPWSIALARRSPVQVTAVDLPGVVPTTRDAVERAGLGDRIAVVAQDVLDAPLGHQAFDLAVVGHLLHLFGEDNNRRLVASVHTALCRGGRIAVIDPVLDPDGASPSLAAYRLGLMLRTRHGRVYPFSAYASWLREAGFHGIQRADLPGPRPEVLITATR